MVDNPIPVDMRKIRGDKPALLHVKELLLSIGVAETEIDKAIEDNQLDLLIIEHMMIGQSPQMNEDELLERTGLDRGTARRFWRALGFTEVESTERVFTDFDAEAIEMMQELIRLGIADEERAIQLARVIGSSVARIAEAQVTMSQVLVAKDDSVDSAELLAVAMVVLLPKLARVMEYAWRRHLQAAARRAWTYRQETDEQGPTNLAVGFADMVGFTYLAQQLDEAALAQIVARFESVAHNTIVEGGGRVVKMIGDEAMFVAEDMSSAASIALDLAEAYADDDLLSDVRVGLSYGPVLLWDGDYYGSVVNRASRIVNIANPGSVLVSGEFHSALFEDPRFTFRPLRPRVLKDIGRTELWSMSRAGSGQDDANRRLGVRWRKLSEVIRDLEELKDHGQRLITSAVQTHGGESVGSEVEVSLEKRDFPTG